MMSFGLQTCVAHPAEGAVGADPSALSRAQEKTMADQPTNPASPNALAAVMASALPIPRLASHAMSYWVDSWQRTVLFWDILRERGNVYLEHEKQGKPPVLVFDYEIIADAREFEPPANYALARIKPPAEHPTDPHKRPFVVIDPRAGHGPGIGGSKIDSEIGIALRAGHPCYFVMFFPEPVPGQTIESVARAEAAFLRQVNALHPNAEGKPFVIGNCQGGWALMLLAAAAPDLVGPILLAGSPISYWAGVEGQNPMRYSGGLMGGSWLASLAADLGHGKFDGAHLVSNFEQLNPANTYWTKLFNLYSQVDTEGPRFVDFERWWGGHFLLNREEMDWIVQNLFVGNKLSSGELRTSDGSLTIDLRNIRSPIVVFASWGDNITPPQQALNWIPDLYDSDMELLAQEQVIVYCLHERVGHLGIFVSSKIAGRETSELVTALDLIDTLPPGLYEAVIEDTRPEMSNLDLIEGRYLIRFERRKIADILALDDGREDEQAFQVVRRVAEVNQSLYDVFVSPWVKAMSNETTAKWMRVTNPDRMQRYLLSDLNPAMWTVKSLAQMVRAQRMPAAPDNPFTQIERVFSDRVERTLDGFRDNRDAWVESVFKAIYESPWVAAAVGMTGDADPRQAPKSAAAIREEFARLKVAEIRSQMDEGTPFDGWVRLLIWQGMEEKVIDERPFNLIRRLGKEQPPGQRKTLTELKEAIKQQMFVLLIDEERAIAALPRLIPDAKQRERAVALARSVATAKGPLSERQEARFQRIEEVLGLKATRRKGAND
jgi:pimeloyl-ACP methyl ester carboxylesterase